VVLGQNPNPQIPNPQSPIPINKKILNSIINPDKNKNFLIKIIFQKMNNFNEIKII